MNNNNMEKWVVSVTCQKPCLFRLSFDAFVECVDATDLCDFAGQV